MNKSIILSAMLALSMPALAADVLYVNGDASQTINGTTSPGWTVTAPIEVTPTDGKFIVEVKNFKDISISYNKKAWKEDGFHSAAKGQEFVFEANEDVINWLQDIFQKAQL